MAAAKGNGYAKKFSDEDIQKIIDDLLDWAHNDNGIYIASYLYEKYKKHKGWLHDLARAYPQMNLAIKQCKDLIGAKIAYHCFLGDRNSSFGEKILPLYDEDYKALLKWKAEIAKEQPMKEDNKGAFNQWKEQQLNENDNEKTN